MKKTGNNERETIQDNFEVVKVDLPGGMPDILTTPKEELEKYLNKLPISEKVRNNALAMIDEIKKAAEK